MITAEEFERRTGRRPEQDDLDRANCTLAGSAMHTLCGWCDNHDKPRYQCGCRVGVKK